jgi:1-acyl-sn-glycerol-3-phosphate acyltransferase
MMLLRSALFAVWFYGGTFVTTFLGLPVLRLGRPRVARYARFWARLMLAGYRHICRVRWEVTGVEHLPAEGPALIASMHQSAFDTLIWIALLPRFTYVFKRELSRIPIFGGYLIASGMIPVDRAAGGTALRALLRETDRAVAGSRQIVIFPEGTRVPPGQRVALLPGVAAMAARSGLPVIPVLTDSGLLWGRNAFRKQPGVIRVAVQPPLPPGLPREEVMARLEALFAQASTILAATPCPPSPSPPGAVDNSVSDAP